MAGRGCLMVEGLTRSGFSPSINRSLSPSVRIIAEVPQIQFHSEWLVVM